MKTKIFGTRFCTYCGGEVKYFLYEGKPIGTCSCGNTDYCDNETKEDVIKRFGSRFKPCDKMSTVAW